jgi:hypothetical protein
MFDHKTPAKETNSSIPSASASAFPVSNQCLPTEFRSPIPVSMGEQFALSAEQKSDLINAKMHAQNTIEFASFHLQNSQMSLDIKADLAQVKCVANDSIRILDGIISGQTSFDEMKHAIDRNASAIGSFVLKYVLTTAPQTTAAAAVASSEPTFQNHAQSTETRFNFFAVNIFNDHTVSHGSHTHSNASTNDACCVPCLTNLCESAKLCCKAIATCLDSCSTKTCTGLKNISNCNCCTGDSCTRVLDCAKDLWSCCSQLSCCCELISSCLNKAP